MIGVGASSGIVVFPGAGEILAAVAVFMDMEGVKVSGTWFVTVGKVEKFSFDDHTSIGSGKEFHQSADLRVRLTSPNPGYSLRQCVGC